MPKPKSSRGAVRKTPQLKKNGYVRALFVDDHGRDRALTVETARSFSKKKLGAASRTRAQKADREMARAIEASDRETARAIRKLRQQERESDRSIARFFRRKIRTVEPPTRKLKHRPPKPRTIRPSRGLAALPSYGGFIRDRQNRIGVFLDIRYYSSRTSKPGVARRTVKYIWNGAALDADGVPVFRSNIGATIEEVVCGFDHLEQVNRSAQKGAKILNSAILAMDHRWTREQMLEVGEAWAKERFGQYGLPFAIALHEPPPDGDEHNWHIHAIWSWRPLERVGDYEWLVSEALRTELDGPEGLRLLRERFAALSTAMSFHRGDCDVYTALSHAARGLPIEPQKKLYEELTRRARAGEFVAANEENHERVVRSKAALIDDDLRREDERLAREVERIRQSAAKVAKTVRSLKFPSLPFKSATLPVSLRKISVRTPRASITANARVPKAPAMDVAGHADRLAERLRPLRDALRPSSVMGAAKVKPVFPPLSVPFVPGKLQLPNLRNSAIRASRHSASKTVRAPSSKFTLPALTKAIPSRASTAARLRGLKARSLAAPRSAMFRSSVPVQREGFRFSSLGRKFANLRNSKVGELKRPSTPPEQASRSHPFEMMLRHFAAPNMAKSVASFPALSPMSVFTGFARPRPRSTAARLRAPRSFFAPRPALQTTTMTKPSEVARIPRSAKPTVGRIRTPGRLLTATSIDRAPRRSQVFKRSEAIKRLLLSIRPRLWTRFSSARPVKFPANAVSRVKSRASVSAVPRPREPSRSRPLHVSRLVSREIPRPVSVSSFGRLQTTLESAQRFLSETSAAAKKSVAEARRSPSEPLTPSSSPWLLLAILAERRSVIRKTPRGRWGVSGELLREAGLTAEQIEAASLQTVLEEQAAKQRAELQQLARFVAKDPGKRLVRKTGGWKLVSTAPEPLRRAIHHWQSDASVQNALSELSSLPPIGEGYQQALAKRASRFLARVFDGSPTDAGGLIRAKPEGKERNTQRSFAGRFPPPNGLGFGE